MDRGFILAKNVASKYVNLVAIEMPEKISLEIGIVRDAAQ